MSTESTLEHIRTTLGYLERSFKVSWHLCIFVDSMQIHNDKNNCMFHTDADEGSLERIASYLKGVYDALEGKK